MANSFEIESIHQAVEETPFSDPLVRKFFGRWCEINDSISPRFISRQKWNNRGATSILEESDQGNKTLFLPEDLHPWEMMNVIETVDNDTFARNPEKKEEKANQIQELGETFEKAGLYLSEYLPDLDEDNGKQIAQNIAQEFYNYGLSLQHKEQRREDIPEASSLTEEDKTKLDEWFLGREAYQKRIKRLGVNPNLK